MIKIFIDVFSIPIISIFLTLIIKAVSKPDSLKYEFNDWLDFGTDLIVSAIVVSFSDVNDKTDGWVWGLSMVMILITSIIIRRLGWDIPERKLNRFGIVFQDIVGFFLLLISSLHKGGFV